MGVRDWSEIAADPQYKALPPDGRAAVRDDYFAQVLAPSIDTDVLAAEKAAFSDRTARDVSGPGLLERASGPPATAESIKALSLSPRSLVGRGLGGAPAEKPLVTQGALQRPYRDPNAPLTDADLAGNTVLSQAPTPPSGASASDSISNTPLGTTMGLELRKRLPGGVGGDLVAGAVGGLGGLAQAVPGLVAHGADIVGAEKVSKFALDTAQLASDFENQAGQGSIAAQVGDSIVQSLPTIAAAVGSGGESLLSPAMRLLFAQTYGQNYAQGRNAGLDPVTASARGAWQSAFEVLGERFGLPEQVTLLKGVLRGMPNAQMAATAGRMTLKEILGEELTTAGQFIGDKYGPGALNPNSTLDDYLKQAENTAQVTAAQSALMGGGPIALRHAVRTVSAADKSIDRAPGSPYQEPTEPFNAADYLSPSPRPAEVPSQAQLILRDRWGARSSGVTQRAAAATASAILPKTEIPTDANSILDGERPATTMTPATGAEDIKKVAPEQLAATYRNAVKVATEGDNYTPGFIAEKLGVTPTVAQEMVLAMGERGDIPKGKAQYLPGPEDTTGVLRADAAGNVRPETNAERQQTAAQRQVQLADEARKVELGSTPDAEQAGAQRAASQESEANAAIREQALAKPVAAKPLVQETAERQQAKTAEDAAIARAADEKPGELQAIAAAYRASSTPLPGPLQRELMRVQPLIQKSGEPKLSIDEGARNLRNEIQARLAYAELLSRNHDWSYDVGDVLQSKKTGRSYTIEGKSFTAQGQKIVRGEQTKLVPTYSVRDSGGNTNLFREDKLLADTNIKNISRPFTQEPKLSIDEGPVEPGASKSIPEYGEPQPGAISVVGVHYSQEPRTELSGDKYGTGYRGAERDRLEGESDLARRTYFYVDEGNGVKPESGVGGVAHRVRLNNIYDPRTHLLGRPADDNTFERHVMAAGFDGYYAPGAYGKQGGVVLLGQEKPIPVAADIKSGRGEVGVPVPQLTVPETNRLRLDVPSLRIKNGVAYASPAHEAVLRAALEKVHENRSQGLQAGGEARNAAETGRAGGVRLDEQVRANPGAPSGPALTGLPTAVVVDGRTVTFGPNFTARAAAAEYMKQAGLKYAPPTSYVKIDPARAKRLADAFEAMPHTPDDPQVKEAYEAMIRETLAQYQAIKAAGLKVEFIAGPDPYGNPRNVLIDVRDNNHMWVFPTDDGFGGEASGNPLLRLTDETISGRPARVNDIFRVVHDYFGHIKEGVGFRAEGEENAWQAHRSMYSPLAARAMTTETRGQNSWVNFGPYAESNKTASPADTEYAPQKIGLLPEWASEEGYAGGAEPKLSIDESSRNAGLNKRQAAVSLIQDLYAPFKLTQAQKLGTVGEVAQFLQDRALKALGTPITENTPVNRRFIAKVIQAEAREALGRVGNAGQWYKKSLSDAVDGIAALHPEVRTDDDARFLWQFSLALTSNGQTIPENVRLAAEAYQSFKSTGSFPSWINGGGKNAKSIRDAFAYANDMTREIGVTAFRKAMLQQWTARDLEQWSGRELKGVFKDATVYGGSIFGPKIGGAFLQNLNGNFDPLTIDRWMMRTWGRLTGNLVDSQAETGIIDAPAGAAQRKFITDTMAQALDNLRADGTQLDMADLQAAIWYPEKELYGLLGRQNTRSAPTDYATEVDKYVGGRAGAGAQPGGRQPAAAEQPRAGLQEPLFSQGGLNEGASPRAPSTQSAGSTPDEHRAAAAVLQAQLAARVPGFVLDAVPAPDGARVHGIDALAQALGRDVMWVSQPGTHLFNGLYSSRYPNTIIIDTASTRPAAAVFGHEFVHSLASTNEQSYNDLVDALLPLIHGERGRYAEINAKRAENGLPALDGRNMLEELVADIVGDRFTEPEFWQSVASRSKQPTTILGRVLDTIKSLISKITQVRPFGTERYLTDLRAARQAVADVLSKYIDGLKGETNGNETETQAGAEQATANATNAAAAGNGDVRQAEKALKESPAESRQPFYSELRRAVENSGQARATPGQWISTIKSLPRVKPDEIAWTGVEDWLRMQPADAKVTREQIAEFLRGNGVKVEETVLGQRGRLSESEERERDELNRSYRAFEERGIGDFTAEDFNRLQELEENGDTEAETNYGAYTLPGGKNYRELLLTLPQGAKMQATLERGADGKFIIRYADGTGEYLDTKDRTRAERALAAKTPDTSYRSAHWDQKNVLAHIRFNERTDAEGKRVLFIEEVQSDWGQEGKKKGFKEDRPPRSGKVVEDGARPSGGSWWRVEFDDGSRLAGYGSREAAERALVDAAPHGQPGVPRAPFVGKTDAWLALAIKRMIKYAVDNGFDRVAFVNGEQSADRYDLSKQVSKIIYGSNPSDGTLNVMVMGKDGQGEIWSKMRATPAELEDVVGKEVVAKMVGGDGQRHSSANGAYDKSLTGLDLKVGGEGMKTFYDKIVPQVARDLSKKLGGEGLKTVRLPQRASPTEIDRHVEEHGYPPEDVDLDQPGFDITPSMREKAAGGLPLFSLDEKQKEGWRQRIVTRIDNAVNAIGNLPDKPSYMADRYETLGRIGRADKLAGDARQALRKGTPEDRRAVYAYLTDAQGRPGSITDQKVRTAAVQVKNLLSSISDNLVQRGLISPDVREEYRDAYLPRVYLKYLLEDDYNFGRGKKVSDLGNLKKRKDIPEDVRRVMLGEIKDAPFLASLAISRPLRDMALLDFMGRIAQHNQWTLPNQLVEFAPGMKATPQWLQAEAKWLRRRADYPTPADAAAAKQKAEEYDRLAIQALDQIEATWGTSEKDTSKFKRVPDTPRYGQLRGMWVRKEIHDDLVGAFHVQPGDLTIPESLLGYGGLGTRLQQIFKVSKVTLNPPSQVRNIISNGVMLQLSGVPMPMVPVRLLQAAIDMRNNGPVIQAARKYGLTEATFAGTELPEAKTEMIRALLDEGGMSNIRKMGLVANWLGRSVVEGAGHAYQYFETLFKVAKMKDELAHGAPEWKAAIEAHKWLYDYTDVDPAIKYARNVPLGAPFATWFLKTQPRLAEVALMYPHRLIPWVALWYGLPYLWAASGLGADPDDVDKMKKVLPEWMRKQGGIAALPVRDSEGRYQVINTGPFFPWAFWGDTAQGFQNGSVADAMKPLAGMLFGGPVADTVSMMKTGVDPFTQKPVADKGDPVDRQFWSWANYIYNEMAPSFITSQGVVSPFWLADEQMGGKLAQAVTGNTDKYGNERSTYGQALSRLMGANVYGIDPENSKAQQVLQFNQQVMDARQRLVMKMQDQSLPDAQRAELVREYSAEMQRRADRLTAFQGLEVPESVKPKK